MGKYTVQSPCLEHFTVYSKTFSVVDCYEEKVAILCSEEAGTFLCWKWRLKSNPLDTLSNYSLQGI